MALVACPRPGRNIRPAERQPSDTARGAMVAGHRVGLPEDWENHGGPWLRPPEDVWKHDLRCIG